MVLALGPVGCGFQPIYARSGGAAASPMADHLASVRVSAIEDRIGQQLRNNLVATLSPRGEPASPAYMLTVRLTETNQGLATSKDGNTTVGKYGISAQYSLQDARTGKTLHSGTANAFSGYRFLGPRYASTASQRDSASDVLVELAAEIRGALAAYFSDPETFNARAKAQTVMPLVAPRSETPFQEGE